MEQTNTAVETQWVLLSLIDVPSYARVHRRESLLSLAQNVSKNGQLQNIVVSQEGDRFELVIGKGRLEAARQLGWERIRADVKVGLTKVQKLTMIASENSEREDASPFYTGFMYKMIMEAGNLTQDEMAAKLGKDRSVISRYLTLTKVSPEIWQEHQSELTSMRQCLEIAKVEDPNHQKQMVEAAAKEGLTGAKIKKLAKHLKSGGPATAAQAGGSENPAPFSFAWKGDSLVVKGRVPKEGFTLETHVDAYRTLLSQFLGTAALPIEPGLPEKEAVVA